MLPGRGDSAELELLRGAKHHEISVDEDILSVGFVERAYVVGPDRHRKGFGRDTTASGGTFLGS